MPYIDCIGRDTTFPPADPETMAINKKPAQVAQAPAQDQQPIAQQTKGQVISFDEMFDAIDSFVAAPLPAAPSIIARKAKGETASDSPAWEASAQVIAACESVQWGIPFAKRGTYSPAKLDNIGATIPTTASGSDKKGKLQKHLILQFVHGLGGAIPAIAEGEEVNIAILAKYIAKYPNAFGSLSYAKTMEGMLKKVADYTNRFVVRNEDMITLTSKRASNK